VEDGGIERFAEVYGTELGLSGEFVYVDLFYPLIIKLIRMTYSTAISHSIREQILLYQKSIFLDPSTSSEILLPTISTSDQSTIYRSSDQIQHTTPFLSTLSLAELEKLEREREKEVRRKKRQTRGRRAGGVPGGGDWREVQKTWRSAVGNVTMINLNEGGGEGSNFFNNNSVVPVGTRRAAAAAASATIASLAASENGTSYHHTHHHQITLTATQPNHPAPSAPPKAKRQKIFHQQGPNLPQSIFIERSTYSLNTLTSSTSLNNPSTSDLTSFSRPPNKKPPTPTTSTPRAPTARQLKEAKEKEYAEGQRENYINGEWHCSNCGCPDAIAVGRRKGPLGDKTMCGECGEYISSSLRKLFLIESFCRSILPSSSTT
jgi:SWI/SNF-related matrix-associated actin-dependent regulator of chromatin subfamily B protein 1